MFHIVEIYILVTRYMNVYGFENFIELTVNLQTLLIVAVVLVSCVCIHICYIFHYVIS